MRRMYSLQVIKYAAIAQLVERIHGKDEVLGSNPSRGSRFYLDKHMIIR